MKSILIYIILFSLLAFGDCNAPFKNTPYNKRKFSYEAKLNQLSSRNSIEDITSSLKEDRIRYKVVNFEEEKVIELLGKDKSHLSKLVRHAKKYETRVFIAPSLKEEGLLGFFQTNEDLQRYIFLSPTEVFIKSTEGYSTLVHELRHARYDFLRELQVDSFYHTSLISKNDAEGLLLKGHKFHGYKNFQSIEELPLHIKDIHSEILTLRKMQRVTNPDLLDFRLGINQTIELHERVLHKIPTEINKKTLISALNDGDEVIITVNYKKSQMVYSSFDERLLDQDEIRLTKENLDIVKEIISEKNFKISQQSQKIVENLKAINKKIDDINIRKGKNQLDKDLDEILQLSKKNIQLIRE